MVRLNTRRAVVTVLSQCPPHLMETLGMDGGLGFFWHNRPDLQREALLRIAAHPHGSVTVACSADRLVVGYVTVTPPDDDTRWGRDRIPGLYELGGIEVSRAWRGLGIGRALLAALFADDSYAEAIVIATGYRWCWDYESAGLPVHEYRGMLHRLFRSFGFEFFETDEPNIAWYPDNALVARVGPRVPAGLLGKFRGLLFENVTGEYVTGEFVGR